MDELQQQTATMNVIPSIKVIGVGGLEAIRSIVWSARVVNISNA